MAGSILNKLGRELSRFGRQMVAAPGNLWRYQTERRHYDRVTARQIVTTDGQVAQTDRVALYLIFPGMGVQPSHLRALRWMTDNGYAPLVVSNLPLGDADKAQLLPLCWRILERPNVGYDFGGYRDGILHLGDTLPALTRLVFLNDSSWFPMPGTEDWLQQAETAGPDFVAASYHWGIDRVRPHDFRTIRWRFGTGNRNFHYGSFALSVGPAVLRDPGFFAFWKAYRLTGDKSKTVRRGETGFTRWVLRSGHSHAATHDIATLDADLAAMSDDRLADLAAKLILHEDSTMRQVKLDTLASAQGRDRAVLIPLILTAIARQGVSYALPHHLIRDKAYPFLKKSPLWASADTHAIMVDFLHGIDGDLGTELRAEATATVQARAPHLTSGATSGTAPPKSDTA